MTQEIRCAEKTERFDARDLCRPSGAWAWTCSIVALEILNALFRISKAYSGRQSGRSCGRAAAVHASQPRNGTGETTQLDLHQLEIFLAVMDASGVTRAAEKIQLTPGAVSIQIQRLSAELHAQLFVRNGRELKPTPAALRLSEHARRVLKQVRHIQQDFEDDPRADTRPFHFATGVTTLVYRLGGPLRKLRQQFPQCDFHVSVGPTEEIVSGLLDRRLDLGLISLPVAEEHLEITPLFDEELFLLTPSTTLVRGGPITSVSPADLEGVPFLLYPKRSNMRVKIDRFLKDLGITPRVMMEADDTEAIKRLVECGFGYSILPEQALRGRARFFRVHRIGQKRLIRKQALASVRSDFPRKLTTSIANFLVTAMRKQ